MLHRILRHVFSALLLGTFAVLAMGTSISRPGGILGDTPLAMVVHGDKAYLLYHSTGSGSEEHAEGPGLTFVAIGQGGTVDVLQTGEIPPIRMRMATAAVTATAESAVAILLAGGVADGNERPFAAVAMEPWTSPQVSWLGDGQRLPRDGGLKLSLNQLDTGRYRAYYSQASFGHQDMLPLIEVEDGVSTLIEPNVVWAHCTRIFCQQLRYAEHWLWLYTNADGFAEPVSSTWVVERSYSTGETEDGDPALFSGDRVYVLSTTSPSLTERERRNSDVPQGHREFTAPFTDGGWIEVSQESVPLGGLCDRDCEDYSAVGVYVSLYGADGILKESFFLNAYDGP